MMWGRNNAAGEQRNEKHHKSSRHNQELYLKEKYRRTVLVLGEVENVVVKGGKRQAAMKGGEMMIIKANK